MRAVAGSLPVAILRQNVKELIDAIETEDDYDRLEALHKQLRENLHELRRVDLRLVK